MVQRILGNVQTGNDCDHVQRDKDQLYWDLEPLHQGEEVALQRGPVCLSSLDLQQGVQAHGIWSAGGDFIYLK